MKNIKKTAEQEAALSMAIENSIFEMIGKDFLVMAANGQLDLNELAKLELKARYLNNNGEWIGASK